MPNKSSRSRCRSSGSSRCVTSLDIDWLFATREHRELFEADPAKYAPAFGGHCAVGRALGASLPGSPKRWRIDGDRLYISKNRFAALQFPLFARRIRTLADQGGRR